MMLSSTRSNTSSIRDSGPPGYLSATYARGLSEFGRPRRLFNSNGWILERQIEGSDLVDGLGAYPLFCCTDWRSLSSDLHELQSGLVSLALVADPFGNHDPDLLARLFDRVMCFKEHYVVDVSQPLQQSVKPSHRAAVRRALKKVTVRICPDPAANLEKWLALFSNLVRRHEIRGLRRFSSRSFEYQLRAPGLVMFEALVGGETVGLDLWFVQGDVAYGHLAAFSDAGYQARASYATKWTMLNYFRDKVRWVDLGGAPGVAQNNESGLASFKRGWATGSKTAYFCGVVFNPEVYQRLRASAGVGRTDYFPAYRAGEFP